MTLESPPDSRGALFIVPSSQSQPGPIQLPNMLLGSYGRGTNKSGEVNLQDGLSTNLLLSITPTVGNS